ncbi:GNAT family N-acetyltransferase [Undibacterium pigrum]|uniref:Acetyltransferase (GNAT) family protein n=1 Tax=Undibacterium pigrum TaxID=401470 RepID=A0A318JU65_9BURK|nr:GNAT family N-acetyltransferase [Undibacterium pigrum]PXX44028.1 acetyltransferase (GNAT) family protein [Undibacterium pigrum]
MLPSVLFATTRNKLLKLDARWIFSGLLLLESLLYCLDEFTGPYSFYAPFYIFPVAMSAALLSRRMTVFLVVLSSLARAQVFSQVFQSGSLMLLVFDIVQSILLYGLIAVLVTSVTRMNQRLLRYAQYLRANIRLLRQQRRNRASIRRALPEDADGIVRLAVNGAQSGDLSEDISNAVLQRTLVTAFRQGIVEGQTVRHTWAGGQQKVPVEFWVSIINGRMAGFFMLYGVDNQQGSERELHAMVVADEYRGLGIGAAMTDFFCMHFKNRRLFAACKSGSNMMKMLSRRGFSLFSTTENEYVIIERHN